MYNRYMEFNNLLNNLLFEMIKIYTGDPKRIQHFIKVHNFAQLIATKENLDERTLFILETAAYTHDIGIKYCEEQYNGNCNGKLQEKEGPAPARILLHSLQFDNNCIDRVCYLIAHHHTYNNIKGMDYQILIEADFLVNIYEDNMPKEKIKTILETIFQSKTGKKLCRLIYKL